MTKLNQNKFSVPYYGIQRSLNDKTRFCHSKSFVCFSEGRGERKTKQIQSSTEQITHPIAQSKYTHQFKWSSEKGHYYTTAYPRKTITINSIADTLGKEAAELLVKWKSESQWKILRLTKKAKSERKKIDGSLINQIMFIGWNSLECYFCCLPIFK